MAMRSRGFPKDAAQTLGFTTFAELGQPRRLLSVEFLPVLVECCLEPLLSFLRKRESGWAGVDERRGEIVVLALRIGARILVVHAEHLLQNFPSREIAFEAFYAAFDSQGTEADSDDGNIEPLLYKKECEFCGELFIRKRSTARFCSAKCRVYWNRKAKATA